MDIFGFSTELNNLGYNTQPFRLPTVDCPDKTIQHDVTALEEDVLCPLIEEQGKDVVLYLHSYAGFPGSTAIKGYSKAERNAEGKRGGIIGLIYQSAFIPTPGDTLLYMIGGRFGPWQDSNSETGLVSAIDPITTFWADVAEPEATMAADIIRPQSLLSFKTPSAQTYYAIPAYDNRRVYLHTMQDQALAPYFQRSYVSGSGVHWEELELDTSHNPFFSVPQELATIVAEKVETFLETY